jgi:hypothetical protein
VREGREERKKMQKYDPAVLLGVTTSLLAIISSAFTIITLSRDWRRRTDIARDAVDVRRREVDVLELVMGECWESLNLPYSYSSSYFEMGVGCSLNGYVGTRGVETGVGIGGLEVGGRQENGGGDDGDESRRARHEENIPRSVIEAFRMCEQRRRDLRKLMAGLPGMHAAGREQQQQQQQQQQQENVSESRNGESKEETTSSRSWFSWRRGRRWGLLSWWSSSGWLAVNLRLPLVEKDLKRRYEMFKEDVLLLRALCSE